MPDGLPEFYGWKMTGAALLVLLVGVAGLRWRRRRRQARRSLWPTTAILSVAVCAGAMILLEVSFSVCYDQTDTMTLTNVSRRWFERHVRANNAGARDSQPFTPIPPPGVFRITLVGDSFTYGHGIRDVEDRFGDQLKNRLDESAPGRFQVYNWALCGADTQDHINIIKLLSLGEFNCNLVLLVYVLNDACPLLPESEELARQAQYLQPHFPLFRDTYLFNFLYWRFVHLSMTPARDYATWIPHAYQEPFWSKHREQLEQIVTLCRQQGWELRVVTFPLLQSLGPHYPLRDAHDRLASFWTEHEISNVDLLPILEAHDVGDLVVNRFDAHPNELAHRLAAQAIYEHILTPDAAIQAARAGEIAR